MASFLLAAQDLRPLSKAELAFPLEASQTCSSKVPCGPPHWLRVLRGTSSVNETEDARAEGGQDAQTASARKSR